MVQLALRDDVVLAGVVLLVVDAHHDGDVFVLRRGGDDDLLRAGGDVALGLLGLGEQAGAFDHVLDAEVLPRQRGRAFLDGQALDLVAVDDEDVVLGARRLDFLLTDFAVEPALGRVVLEQVGEVVGRDEVVDGDDVELLAEQPLFDQRPEHQPADAPEPVDADFHRSHDRVSPLQQRPARHGQRVRVPEARRWLRYDSTRLVAVRSRSRRAVRRGAARIRYPEQR